MYYSNGKFCESKTYFEDHESNSPVQWTDTTLFESLVECCREVGESAVNLPGIHFASNLIPRPLCLVQ